MLEVDVTEEAKQVALYRYELTGELYDDDEIRSFYDDIVNLDVEANPPRASHCEAEGLPSLPTRHVPRGG